MAEFPFLYEKLSGREFIHFLADIFGRKYRHANAIAAPTSCSQPSELTDAADQLIETYSQGMRQKTARSPGVLVH